MSACRYIALCVCLPVCVFVCVPVCLCVCVSVYAAVVCLYLSVFSLCACVALCGPFGKQSCVHVHMP